MKYRILTAQGNRPDVGHKNATEFDIESVALRVAMAYSGYRSLFSFELPLQVIPFDERAERAATEQTLKLMHEREFSYDEFGTTE